MNVIIDTVATAMKISVTVLLAAALLLNQSFAAELNKYANCTVAF